MTVKNETLLPLFTEMKSLMAPYAERLTARHDEPGYFDLWSEKTVEIEGRRRSAVYFGGLIIQKSYVGLYFMPAYAGTDLKETFGAELLATLKGKSCFHIKELTPALRKQIEVALAVGFRAYEERGWV
jgi:hypothetical protein